MQLLRVKSMQLLSKIRTTKKRFIMTVSFGLFGVLYLKVLSPTLNIHIPCVFREVTGHFCPGCGVTRLCLSLLEFDFYQAFRFNMLVFVLAPLYLAWLLSTKMGHKKTSSVIMSSMLILTISFGVLRNTDQFSWLAPTHL